MRRLCACLLSAALFLTPALAAEEGFSDVQPGDWFAPHVAACCEAGLMSDTGGGTFTPEGIFTELECLTVLLRFHDLQQEGSGALSAAPDSWGSFTLTLADGTQRSGWGGNWDDWRWGSLNHYDGSRLFHRVAWKEQADQALIDWGRAAARPSTLTVNGISYPGRASFSIPLGAWEFDFTPDESVQAEASPLIRQMIYCGTGPDCWYRNTMYTYCALPESLRTALEPLAAPSRAPFPITRLGFAQALAAVLDPSALEPVRHADALPDTDDPAVLALYNAGIVSGVDETGAFAPEQTLTRADAAAMLAQALKYLPDAGQSLM